MKEAAVTGTNHNAILENRKNLLLTGVTDVESFDERTVSLFTQKGELTGQGRQLHVNGMNLESGEVTFEGDAWARCYGERDKRGPLSLLGKLFRYDYNVGYDCLLDDGNSVSRKLKKSNEEMEAEEDATGDR